MEERDFFEEVTEQKTHTMVCPHCGQPGEYELNWLVRRKRAQVPRGADENDRARFAKARSYMVRRDDLVGCKNIRCRKRFEVVGIQSVADLQQAAVGTPENRAERIRAAFGRRRMG
jgi:sarcosine oxidase delta subunit